MWVSFAIFALESLINFRQGRLQDCQWQQNATKGDRSNGALQRPQDIQRARTKVIFRTMTAGHFMLLVLLFVKMDVAPWLWDLVGDFQTAFLPTLTNEFWRSCLFLIFCLFIYVALNLPNFIFRSMILKDDVMANIAAGWKPTWRLHDLARDNVMPTVLLFVTVSDLFYQACGFKFNKFYVPVFAAAQLMFGILYPIMTQPNTKQLSLLEPGNLNDEIHELALSAKLKLKDIYVSSGPLPKNIEDGVQTFGWPRMKYLSIHESVIDQCTEEDIKALTAQQFGCWTYGNNVRAFIASNVRCLTRPVLINADTCSQIVITQTFSMVMLFIRQKTSYTQWNFPAGMYPKIAGIVIFSLGFAPISWVWFTVQMHYMHRKNAFMAGKTFKERAQPENLADSILRQIRGYTGICFRTQHCLEQDSCCGF